MNLVTCSPTRIASFYLLDACLLSSILQATHSLTTTTKHQRLAFLPVCNPINTGENVAMNNHQDHQLSKNQKPSSIFGKANQNNTTPLSKWLDRPRSSFVIFISVHSVGSTGKIHIIYTLKQQHKHSYPT